MLSLMRKHARNWLMKVILGIIILVFIFYFGSLRGTHEAEKILAVDDIIVTVDEFRKEYRQLLDFYRRQYSMELSDSLLEILDPKRQVYDSLLNRAVIRAKAEELNLDVGAEEVQQTVLSNPNFQIEGVFDLETYERSLRYLGMKPEDFETLQKRSLIISKVERLIKESVKVSEFEAYDLYRLQNQALRLAYAKIDPEAFTGTLVAADEILEEYFDKNAEAFRIPRKVKVRYLRFPVSDYLDSVSVTEEMIEKYYYENPGLFLRDKETKEKEGGEEDDYIPLEKVRDRIAEELAEDRAFYKAYEEAKRAHDTIYQNDNFEEYAAELGIVPQETEFFSEEDPPDELAAVENLLRWAFELGPGEMSPVLSDEKAHYLVKVVDEQASRIPTLEEVRNRVENMWRAEESLRLAREKALEILADLQEGKSTLADLPEEEFLRKGETGFFSPGDEIPEIGYSEKIIRALFRLSEKSPVAEEVFFVDGCFTIIQLLEKEPIDEAEWEKRKEDVTASLLRLKKDILFRSWLEETRNAMMKSGRLKIYARPEDL